MKRHLLYIITGCFLTTALSGTELKADEQDAPVQPTFSPNASGWDGFTTLADFYDTFEKEDTRIGNPSLAHGKQYSGIGYGFLIGRQADAPGKDVLDTGSKKPLVFSRVFGL